MVLKLSNKSIKIQNVENHTTKFRIIKNYQKNLKVEKTIKLKLMEVSQNCEWIFKKFIMPKKTSKKEEKKL